MLHSSYLHLSKIIYVYTEVIFILNTSLVIYIEISSGFCLQSLSPPLRTVSNTTYTFTDDPLCYLRTSVTVSNGLGGKSHVSATIYKSKLNRDLTDGVTVYLSMFAVHRSTLELILVVDVLINVCTYIFTKLRTTCRKG